MWPRMDFVDLQQLDRWPNGWMLFNNITTHDTSLYIAMQAIHNGMSTILMNCRFSAIRVILHIWWNKSGKRRDT